ncbi:MAG: hypothetical protein FJ301_02600 [Planctomycetes bacterium]|nr:hypothetical protein [Planctomycetota bacterium]
MTATLSKPVRRLAAVLLAALAASCVSHTHVVGLGPTNSGEATVRQYYIFFGLITLNDVDAQRLAPDVTSYAIDTRFGVVDALLFPLLLPVTATSRTVTVRT